MRVSDVGRKVIGQTGVRSGQVMCLLCTVSNRLKVDEFDRAQYSTMTSMRSDVDRIRVTSQSLTDINAKVNLDLGV